MNNKKVAVLPPLKTIKTLRRLAQQIRNEHRLTLTSAAIVTEHASKVGKLLEQAKKQVPHGMWVQWLETNVPEIATRTAQKYMRFAKLTAHAKTSDRAFLGISAALEQAAARRFVTVSTSSGEISSPPFSPARVKIIPQPPPRVFVVKSVRYVDAAGNEVPCPRPGSGLPVEPRPGFRSAGTGLQPPAQETLMARLKAAIGFDEDHDAEWHAHTIAILDKLRDEILDQQAKLAAKSLQPARKPQKPGVAPL